MATTSQVLAAMRLRATADRPYFGTALFALTLIDRPGYGTMNIDKYGRVYVDTGLIGAGRQWSVTQAAAVLVHELGHWLRKHHERAATFLDCEAEEHRPSLALALNRAEDAELNDDLESGGELELPGGHWTPKTLGEAYGVQLDDHRLFEEYWLKIRDVAHERASRAVESVTTLVRDSCGSGAHSLPLPGDLPPPDGETPGIRDAEGDLLRKQVAGEIRRQAVRSPGSVPGSWVRWADTQLEPPQVPWERELSALCRNAVSMARGMMDYSYRKPSRRGTFNGIIRPAMVRPLPEVGVLIDTSGSMSGEDLTAVLREVQGILRSVGQRRCTVVCADAAVQTVQTVSSAFQIEIKGGGGTDMRVGIERLLQVGGCKVILVLTDGYTPWPDALPGGYQLVVGLVGEGDEYARVPEYVYRTVRIPPVARDESAA